MNTSIVSAGYLYTERGINIIITSIREGNSEQITSLIAIAYLNKQLKPDLEVAWFLRMISCYKEIWYVLVVRFQAPDVHSTVDELRYV